MLSLDESTTVLESGHLHRGQENHLNSPRMETKSSDLQNWVFVNQAKPLELSFEDYQPSFSGAPAPSLPRSETLASGKMLLRSQTAASGKTLPRCPKAGSGFTVASGNSNALALKRSIASFHAVLSRGASILSSTDEDPETEMEAVAVEQFRSLLSSLHSSSSAHPEKNLEPFPHGKFQTRFSPEDSNFVSMWGEKTTWLHRQTHSLSNDPHALRGVHPHALLSCFGAVLRSGSVTNENEGQRGFARSVPIGKLACFLSHSWHGNAYAKTVALYSYFNGIAASIAGAVAVCATLALIVAGLLPRWGEGIPGYFHRELVNPRFPNLVSDSGWCVLVFLSVYVFVFLKWQHASMFFGRYWYKNRLIQMENEGVFFDKLCIHQTSQALKQKGIDAIGAYLIHAQQLIILWDNTYFSRLWCTFEVAVWSCCRHKGDVKRMLHFFPSSAQAFEPLLCITMTAACLLTKFLLVSRAVHRLAAERSSALSLWMILYFPVFFGLLVVVWIGRKFLRNLQAASIALKTFSICDTKCACDRDRLFVEDAIVKLYGSLNAFEEYVRFNLSVEVQQRIGGIHMFTYWMLVRAVGLPLLVHFCGMDQAYMAATNPGDWIEFIFYNCVAWLIICVVAARFSVWCMWVHIDTEKKSVELIICISCSVFGTWGGFIAHSALLAFLKDDLVKKLLYAGLAALHCLVSLMGEYVANQMQANAASASSQRNSLQQARLRRQLSVGRFAGGLLGMLMPNKEPAPPSIHEEIFGKSDTDGMDSCRVDASASQG